MIDVLMAAGSAVALVTPALIEIGKGGAERLGDAGAGKLLAWLREKMTGRAREAMADLEQDPASPDNQADFRKQLVKLLKEDPELLKELQSLLPPPAAAGDTMKQHVEGAGAKGTQIKGSGNSVTM